jgi:hypothetical protein
MMQLNPTLEASPPVAPPQPEAESSQWGFRRIAPLGAMATAALAGYVVALRPWTMHWGATEDELALPLPGDEVVPEPQHIATRAVTVHARPEEIWPWLAQMGRGRGGLYSFDWLDRLFGILDEPSADHVLPEFQDLKAGDTIPVGGGVNWPVTQVEPNRLLLIEVHQDGADVTWTFFLEPIDAETTRLISRNRWTMGDSLKGYAKTYLIGEPTEFVMTREMLLNIKDRAERLADERRAA